MPKPVLLIVLDGIRPDVLRAAIRDGDAPALGLLAEKGELLLAPHERPRPHRRDPMSPRGLMRTRRDGRTMAPTDGREESG